ncbi:unnamed protein product [Parnassius mnemosyne]|uniref:RNA-directed DNA polymerase n=1 Tax=Parnassius mnemosyne TaxID=213953 RepID=A0AAV1M2H5_9NEOP
MKRHRVGMPRKGNKVRPQESSESPCKDSSEKSDTEDEVTPPDTPPARKILRRLLETEVQKAMQELDEELPSVTTRKEHRAASLIPEFDPDNEECSTATAWLKKIDQLGEIHAWSETTKSFYLQHRLRGQARRWYNRLDDYDYSWQEWKQMLTRAFPKHRDFGNMLEEMMSRKKLPTESMTKYYQDKVAMCFRCKLSDSATVSCIIRGLPSSLQANARAYQCEHPEELYEGFLCALDDYQPLSTSIRTRVQSKDDYDRQVIDKKYTPINPDIDPCPRCKKTGHILRNCPYPDSRTCFKCGKQGHIATRCGITPKPALLADDKVKEIKLLQNHNKIYEKAVKINGIHVKSYIDTGSQVNVLSTHVSRLLDLKINPTSIILKGFSGEHLPSCGEVGFKLEIDGIHIPCKAHLTDVDMGNIHLLVGQPIINSDGMVLEVREGKATLKQDIDFTRQMDVIEERARFKVVTTEKERLLPGLSIIKVNVIDNDEDNDVVTTPQHYELRGVSYSIPATLLRGTVGYIKVINNGAQNIIWEQGEVLTRADSCVTAPQTEVQVSPKNYTLPSTSVAKANNDYYSNSIASLLHTSLANVSTIGGINIEDIKSGPLNKNDHDSLITLLTNYSDCFANKTQDLGSTDLLKMKIKLTTEQPIYRQPYRLSHSEQEIVRSKVSELLDAGIIRESESCFASPVIIVKKKNGDSRLCVDYRALNAITVKDRYPLPNIDDQVSKLAGKNFFTSLDLAQSYHQVKIDPEDIHKTAFITPQGHFEYTRVPFGLANAPSVFMRLINKIVDSLRNSNNFSKDGSTKTCNNFSNNYEVLAFLDDLLLPSFDVQSGLDILEKVLHKLRLENLKLNMSKCSFLQNKITYLGHEITPSGIQPGESKLAAVSQFPTPSNVHEIRQFIGLCSYFRKFIKNFAIIARPLTDLTKKNAAWNWGREQSNSFEQLKQCLCTKPILALYDPALPTEIHTDACKSGIAGILLQKQTDNSLRPVMYFSRVTSKEESMYHSYELETLAVVESLRRFRVYIIGKHVKIVTDCTAVRATLTKRDIIPRIARWWLSIQDFDMSVEYRPGERMKHVDALSRNPIDTVNVNRLEVSDWFYTVQYQDDKLKRIIDQLRDGSAVTEISNSYVFSDDRLYKKTLHGNRLVVPALARWRLVQMHHDDIGHVGFQKCIDLIKKDYWFPKMTRFIRKYVTACLHCAYGKSGHGKKEGKLFPIPKPTEPMIMIHVDHLGPFCKTAKGYQYMLVITDSFSKFVIAEPTRTVNSVETIRTLRKIFSLFGYPDKLVSDHGKAFTSRYFKKFSSDKQFRHILTSVACPRANGQVERTNRTILNALRATDASEAANNWANSLPDILWGINNTANESTTYRPYDLMFSKSSRPRCDIVGNGSVSEPVDVRRNNASKQLKLASDRMKRNFDKKRKTSRVYKKGDLVLWRQAPTSSTSKVNTKLDDVFSGPYIVIKVLGNDRYRIRSIKGLRGYRAFTGLVAADSLRPYHSTVPISDSASSSDEQLETEDLIDLLES